MCIAYGSIDQATSVCPMCKAFPHARCPHVREVCRNRALHPRMDVSYLKNAEVELFNGCGYCKWARSQPNPKVAGVNNPGWPGCCRSPAPHEYRFIGFADWSSVSIIHRIPIPHEVKSALDSMSSMSTRSLMSKSSQSSADRKVSGSPSMKPTTPKSISTPPGKSTKQGSPQSPSSPLSGSLSRASQMSVSAALEKPIQRRSATSEIPDLAGRGRSPNRGPDRTTPPRKQSGGQLLTPPLTPKMNADSRQQTVQTIGRRRGTITSSSNKPSPPSSRTNEVLIPQMLNTPTGPRSIVNEDEGRGSNSGSSDSIGGGGSSSDNTIDGGFTDYLSDESEAELQRLAEAKAALEARLAQEEMEFKSVRQQFAHVDLRPPKTWNPTTIVNTSGRG